MSEPGLFDIEPIGRAGPAARRTARQRFLITIGLHPLSVHLNRSLRLHWRASRRPTAAVRLAHPTCGTCVHLDHLGHDAAGRPDSRLLKCWINRGERVTRGHATDIRRWWPACVDYEAKRDGVL